MNEILHSITNRASGWPTAALPGSPTFVPAQPDDVLDALRALVGLDAAGMPYHVIGALNIIDAVPDVRQAFGEKGRSYDAARYVRPFDQFTGGILRANRHGEMSINRIATEWPVRMDISTTILGDGATVQVAYADQIQTVGATYGNGYMSVEWPAGAGINGRVEGVIWSPLSVFRIFHEPGNFPVGAMLTKLIQHEAFHIMLGASGWAAAFHQATDPVEQAAIFYLALGRSNRAVYP